MDYMNQLSTLLLDIKLLHEEVAKEAEALLDRYIKHRGDIQSSAGQVLQYMAL